MGLFDWLFKSTETEKDIVMRAIAVQEAFNKLELPIYDAGRDVSKIQDTLTNACFSIRALFESYGKDYQESITLAVLVSKKLEDAASMELLQFMPIRTSCMNKLYMKVNRDMGIPDRLLSVNRIIGN